MDGTSLGRLVPARLGRQAVPGNRWVWNHLLLPSRTFMAKLFLQTHTVCTAVLQKGAFQREPRMRSSMSVLKTENSLLPDQAKKKKILEKVL